MRLATFIFLMSLTAYVAWFNATHHAAQIVFQPLAGLAGGDPVLQSQLTVALLAIATVFTGLWTWRQTTRRAKAARAEAQRHDLDG